MELYGVGLAELQHGPRVPGEEPALWVVQHFHAALSRDHVPFCIQQDQGWDTCKEGESETSRRREELEGLLPESLSLCFYFGHSCLLSSSGPQSPEHGREEFFTFFTGEARQESANPQQHRQKLTNQEETWVRGGRGRGFPGSAFLRLQSVLRFLSSDYSAQAAVSIRAFIEQHNPTSSAPRKVVQVQDLTLYSVESVES